MSRLTDVFFGLCAFIFSVIACVLTINSCQSIKPPLERRDTICTSICAAWENIGCRGQSDPFNMGLQAISSVSECLQRCDDSGAPPLVDIECLFAVDRCDGLSKCIIQAEKL